MILVIAWSMLLLGLALVIGQAVIKQIRPSEHSADSYAALAAAQAGVDDYRARLLKDPAYYTTAHSDNLALTQFVPVPGGDAVGEFRYTIDSSRAGAGGEIHVFVTGRSPAGAGGVTRTLEATYSKRSTLDYAYMSDLETTDPYLPNAYSTVAPAANTYPYLSAQQLAANICNHYWWTSGAVNPPTSQANATANPIVFPQGTQRNQRFCQWAPIVSGERLIGYVHTNDVWRLPDAKLDGSGSYGQVFLAGRLSDSCPPISAESPVGCPNNTLPSVPHRYMDQTEVNSANNGAGGCTTTSPAVWLGALGATSSCSNTVYQGDTATPTAGTYDTGRNPRYDTVLELPLSPALLKQRASEHGCVYTGPTRIDFVSTGKYFVTSPDTKQTAPWCDGTATGTTLDDGTATAQTTKLVDLANFTDFVIYVQNVPRTATDDPNNAFDLNNVWATGTDPGCAVKSGTTQRYPYVIPNQATDTAEGGRFTTVSGHTFMGYPSEYADTASPWYGYSGASSLCGNGDAYLQGTYKGSLTISTENNVVLTGSVLESLANTSTGVPNTNSTSVLGLVSGKFTYVYRPTNSSHNWVSDWQPSNATNPKFNAAILAIDRCWGAQDPYYSAGGFSTLTVYGSIAHHYRCRVGVNSGYSKNYNYDSRLARHTPPYMLELSNEPWHDGRTGELVPTAQPAGTTRTYTLVGADEATSTLTATTPSVTGHATSPVTWSQANKTVTVSTLPANQGTGLVVVTYEVNVSGASSPETRRLVISSS